MQQLSERAVRTGRDQLAFVENWAGPRDDTSERLKRAWRIAALWFAAIMGELFVVGLIYRAVMSRVASM